MNTGDIILVPFPFAELTNKKVRPAVVVCETRDKYQDIVVCAVSSIVPELLSENELLLHANQISKLRVDSVLKIDRIVTVKNRDVIAVIGKLETDSLVTFIEKFKRLVD